MFSDDKLTDDDGPMFGPKPGSWSVSSKTDPRWNQSGVAYVGGFALPWAVLAWLEEAHARFGERPADLYWSYMKD